MSADAGEDPVDGVASAEPPKRRRWLRRVLRCGLVALAVSVLVLLAAYIFRERIVSSALPRLLGDVLDLDVSVQRVDMDGLGDISLVGLEGSQPGEDAVLRGFSVRRARVRLRPTRLITAPLEAIEAIELDLEHLTVDLDHGPSRDGEEVDDPSSGDGLPISWPADLPALVIHADLARLQSGDDFLEIHHADLRGGAGESLALATRLDWRLLEREGRVRVDALSGYQAGRLRDLDLSLDGEPTLARASLDWSTIAIDADVVYRGSRGRVASVGFLDDEWNSVVQVDEFPIGAVSRILTGRAQSLSGRLDVDLEADLPWYDLLDGEADWRLALSDARIVDLVLESLRTSGSLVDGRTLIESLEMSGDGARVEGEGLGLDLGLVASGDWLEALDGVADISIEHVPRALIRRFDVSEEWLAFLDAASLRASVRADSGGLLVEWLELHTAIGSLDLDEGSFWLDSENPHASDLCVDGRLSIADLARLPMLPGLADSGLAELGLAGDVVLAGRVEGPLHTLFGEAEIVGSRIVVDEFPVGDIDGSLSSDGRFVDVERLLIHGDDPSPLEAWVSGSLDLQDQSLLSTRLQFRALASCARFEAWPEIADALGASDWRVDARLEGTLSDLALLLDLEVIDWPLAGYLVGLHAEAAQFDDRLAASVAARTRRGDFAMFEVAGEFAPDASDGSVELVLSDLHAHLFEQHWQQRAASVLVCDTDAARLEILPPLTLAGDGSSLLCSVRALDSTGDGDGDGGHEVKASLAMPGTASVPLVDGPLELSGLRWDLDAHYGSLPLFRERPLLPDRLELTGKLDRGRLEESDSRPGLSLAEAALTLEWDDSDGRREPSASCVLSVPSFWLSHLPGRSQIGRELRGHIGLESSLSGQNLRLDKLVAQCGTVRVEAEGDAHWATDLEQIALGAEVPLPRDLRLDVHSVVRDLGLLKAFSPEIRRVGGRLVVDGVLRGSLHEPSIEVDAQLSDAILRMGELPAVEHLEGRLHVRGPRVLIEGLRGELGGAVVEARGFLHDWLGEREAGIKIRGENVLLVRSDSARVRADATLGLTGPLARLHIDGHVGLRDARVLQELPLVDVLSSLTRQVGGLATRGIAGAPRRPGARQKGLGVQLFSLRQPPFDSWTFDVDVDSESGLDVRGNLLKGVVRPEVALRGTGLIPYLVGTVYLENLVLNLPATKIRVESGGVRFSVENPLQPQLSMNGSTRMRGYDILVSVSGPLNAPVVEFSSSPPLPADQLVTLVTTGQAPQVASGASSQKALFTVATYLGTDLLRKLFGNSDIDATESVLERFEFESGREVTASGSETWEARFRLQDGLIANRDALYLVGDHDRFGHYNFGLRIVFRGR